DVGAQLARQADRLAAVGRLADHLHVGLPAQEQAHARALQRLVVRHEHPRRRCPLGHRCLPSAATSRAGTRARTRHPSPAGPASSAPPYASTRSRMPASPCPAAFTTPEPPPVSDTVTPTAP